MLWSKLMRAANCVRFYLNLFCCEVNNLHVPHVKKDSDKTIHNLQLASALIRSQKTRVEHLHSPFPLFYTINAQDGKLIFLGDFFQPTYTETERPS